MAYPGFVPCHSLCYQTTVAVRHSQPLLIYLDPLSHLFLNKAMQHPCAWNSTHAQLLHNLKDCHLWRVQIGQQLTSWNVRVVRNQGCDGILIEFRSHCSRSPGVWDKFCWVLPFAEHLMPSTNGRFTQTLITIHTSHLHCCISRRHSSTHSTG